MSFIEFTAKYVYRPNFDEVGYGDSSYGISVVTDDPYVFSASRIFIYITIGVGIIACVAILLTSMKRTSVDTHGELAFAAEVEIKRKWLTLLSCLSITASGVHHIDNFLRVDQYFLPAGIYNGFFFILDVGLANWVIAALLLTGGVRHILLNSVSYFQHYNTSSYFDSHHIAIYWVYIHCVMIWSGQLHYSIEQFSHFSTVSNISILMEGWSAIILNLYFINLHMYSFKNDGSVDSDFENVYTVERSHLLEDASEGHEDNKLRSEIELRQNMVRRRSK